MKNFYSFVIAATACMAYGMSSTAAKAQTGDTSIPVGYFNLTAVAGTGTTANLSVLSFPFLGLASIAGQQSGVITGVTSNTLSSSGAGWTAGALSVAASPYVIQITSGSATGRTFLISTATANTSTAVTLDAQESAQVDLTTLGIVTGTDTYAIHACDTLLSTFGAGTSTVTGTTVLGGTNSAGADYVQLYVNGAWLQYYYNTTSGHWLQIGPNTVSDNLPVRPDAGILYVRLPATALNMTATGDVPVVSRQAIVAASGTSFVSTSWPVNLTLSTSGFASIPGWVASGSPTTADRVQIAVSGAWLQYYYDGTHWRRVGPNTINDSLVISAGNAAIFIKLGSATSFTTLSQARPYGL